MIWRIINSVVVFLRWFFLPPEFIVQKINPNAMCPACGAKNGFIRAINAGGKPTIEHCCQVCHAKWHEPPVLEGPAAASSTTVLIAAEAPKE